MTLLNSFDTFQRTELTTIDKVYYLFILELLESKVVFLDLLHTIYT